MFKWLARLFGPAPVAEVIEPRPVDRPTSFFTSDVERRDADRATLVEVVKSRALAVRPGHGMAVGRVGEGGQFVAMDSASGDLMSSAKAAFALYDNGGVPDAQLLWYGSQTFIGFQMCAIMAQHWLVQKACDVPARDAIRNGYKVTVNDGTQLPEGTLDKLRAADKRYGIKTQCRELVRWARTFGIRVALFRVESPDPLYYERPFNPDGITPGSYKGIVQIDPYWMSPELSARGATDPASPEFYEPTHWLIQGKRYHRSHLVICRGPEVADILKPAYMYAGISIPQRIYERIYAAERTANEGPQLALTKRAMVFYTDTGKALAQQSHFEERLSLWARFRDNFGVKVADKDGDKIEQHDTALGDFDATVMTQYQLVAAIANVPATKLLGTTPKGFNATGDYEQDSYHEELESIQTNDMEPLLNRHHLCVIRSEIAPAMGCAPFRVTVEWEPTDTPGAKEEAEIRKINAETAKVYSDIGAIDGTDVRAQIASDPKSGYDDLTDRIPEQPEPEPLMMPGGANPGEQPTLDASEYDAVNGTYCDAVLITNQRHLDDRIVAEKIATQDYLVELSPEFQTPGGRRYRIVINGHHSLAAAQRANVQPVFTEADYVSSDYHNALTKLPAFGVELEA